MEQNIHLCRIRGIEIGANWSLLVIAWLITWGLAGGILPEMVPGRPTAAYWLTGVVAAALFFASLVTHELSHALVARRHGVEVKQITLWMFGGVAKLESDNPDPSTELRVGAVGPIVSLGIGVLAGVLAFGVGQIDVLDLAAAALWWLAAINLLLGVFNLLPAFPLDGGRVLRALLWKHWDDRLRATVAAARAGEVFGYILVFLGFMQFLSGYWIDGIWFVFLGWFLMSAARAESSVVTQDGLLAGVRAADIMATGVIVAPAFLSVEQLIDGYLFTFRHSAYPIVDPGGHPLGMVTLERLRAVPAEQRATTPISRIAFPLHEVPQCQVGDAVTELVPKLVRSRAGRALVFDGEHLVGIVSQSDIVRTLDLRMLKPAAPTARPGAAAGPSTPAAAA